MINSKVALYITLFLSVFIGGCYQDNDALYQLAVQDATTIEQGEIYPLVCLTQTDKNVTWFGDEALLITWHNAPSFYPDNKNIEIRKDAIWTVSFKELQQKYAQENPTNNQERFTQWFGLPLEHGYKYFTILSAQPKNILRPAYTWQPDKQIASIAFDESSSIDYKKWFEKNKFDSQKKYPWTRLGYTYDWGDNNKEYGLSEFIIPKGRIITIHKTYTNTDFWNYLKSMPN